MVCSICRQRGHNRRTCPHNNVTLRTPTQRSIMQNINDDGYVFDSEDDLFVEALNNEGMIDIDDFNWSDDELDSTVEALKKTMILYLNS